MPRYRAIYDASPALYDTLVQAEDADGCLRRHLAALAGNLAGRRVLELGVGTGRLTRWLLQAGACVTGCEQSPAMLAFARERLAAEGLDVSGLTVGDAYAGGFGERWADLAIAGWVFGHAVSWHPHDWRDRVRRALDAMRTTLLPTGRLVILETLGTGTETPAPPPPLAPYFDLLEAEGLACHALRTDYRFPETSAAERAIRFFFGDLLGNRVRDARWTRVPECTGVWSATR